MLCSGVPKGCYHSHYPKLFFDCGIVPGPQIFTTQDRNGASDFWKYAYGKFVYYFTLRSMGYMTIYQSSLHYVIYTGI
jgi:hypothetical protein